MNVMTAKNIYLTSSSKGAYGNSQRRKERSREGEGAVR